MGARMRRDESQDLVDIRNGTVARSAFTSNSIFTLEMDRIFSRSWIYVAHETEIRDVGDYVARTVNGHAIILVRSQDGEIGALLNSCRHRGAKLCRVEAGNSKRFVCRYHGWTYGLDGKLLTTSFDSHLPASMQFSEWGMIKIPRIESFHGLIFVSFDSEAQPLSRFLGDFAWYMEPFLNRTPAGMEVLGPPQRWRVKANWKVGALNFIGDSQHVFTTHAGPLALNPSRLAKAGLAGAAIDRSYQVITKEGHGCTLSYLQDGLPESAYDLYDQRLENLYDETLSSVHRDSLRRLKTAVGTIFPNLSFIETKARLREKAIILRIWNPVSVGETEIISWILAERESTQEYKASLIRHGIDNFGIGGLFEQDDLDLWETATSVSASNLAQDYPFSFHTALPRLSEPMVGHPGPGRAYQPVLAEVAQFEFMRHWAQAISSPA